MGIKGHASRATASAMTIAAATSGLTNCDGTGAVDPAPPPLSCDSVGTGQTLQATGTLVAEDTVSVAVRHLGLYQWAVDSVVVVTGGTIQDVVLPQSNPGTPGVLTFRLILDSGSTGAAFKVFATTWDFETTCQIVRQFSVSAEGEVATVTMASEDDLPLPARQGVALRLFARAGRIVTLEAYTEYPGPVEARWAVSAGTVTPAQGERAAWTLPNEPGIYQAEVILDFGADGVAFDALALEVSS